MRKIELKIDKRTGEIRIEALGFKGKSCAEATAFLKSLGETKDFQQKAEWFEANFEACGSFNTNFCG
jgi:hypothetical protein